MSKVDRAKTYLRDEFFIEMVEAQKDLYKSVIFNSAPDDIDSRERALIKYRAIEEFEASLQSLAQQDEIEKKRFKIF
jgi:hypothetical protein